MALLFGWQSGSLLPLLVFGGAWTVGLLVCGGFCGSAGGLVVVDSGTSIWGSVMLRMQPPDLLF